MRRGLSAAIAAREGIVELNRRRVAHGKPITDMYLGLHVGEVFYGNVGSRERLAFPVVGPAVNEASRIAAMCRSVDQPVLISSAFADVGDIKPRLVSVGRYALRGVARPQELLRSILPHKEWKQELSSSGAGRSRDPIAQSLSLSLRKLFCELGSAG